MLLIAVNLTAAGTAFYLYTSGKDYSVSQKERAHFIGLSYMTMNNEFYKIISEEINARIEAEGDRMVMRDPALDVERQITQIEEMLDMGIGENRRCAEKGQRERRFHRGAGYGSIGPGGSRLYHNIR